MDRTGGFGGASGAVSLIFRPERKLRKSSSKGNNLLSRLAEAPNFLSLPLHPCLCFGRMKGRHINAFPCSHCGLFKFTDLCFLLGAQYGDPFPRVASSYLMQLNGQTLWAHKPTAKLPPASLTKIMTALLVLERGKLDEIVTIGPTVSRETGTRIGLRRKERVRVDFLLTASLLGSANDACRSLAEHIGGNEADFVALMNRRAKELGLEGTHFTNASGHDNPGHYSTARDLAILAGAALKHPAFAERVKWDSAYIATVEGRPFFFENKNELIGRYPGAIGVKTGFTPKAGKCLIALAEREGLKGPPGPFERTQPLVGRGSDSQ